MRIANDYYSVGFDPSSGAITSVFDKRGGLELIREPRLADCFRLLLPLPDLQANYVVGREQRLTSLGQMPTGVVLRWGGPLRSPQGSFAVSVTMTIELLEDSISFSISVENRTEHELAEVWFPMLGGLLGLGDRRDTRLLMPTGGWASVYEPFVRFPESMAPGGGVPGSRFPEFLASYPGGLSMPWVDFHDAKLDRGLYFASHDPSPRFRALRLEMHPGIQHNTSGENWPRPEDRDARFPWGVVLHWASFPFTPPGERFAGGPVVLQAHAGDWHQAALRFRQWFTSTFTLADPDRSWMHRHLAVQDTMFLLPEGNVILRFADIPQWARDARDYGVRSVLISGWNIGGHDSHYPYYEPDPRLGTWEELAAGVRACHDLGMRVIFFANLAPVDCDTDWYRSDLHRFRAMNRWGISQQFGFGMGTLGARLGFTARPLTHASSGFPEFREAIVRQLRRLAEIGADGVHLDKLAPPAMDFNPDLPLAPDLASWLGTLRGLEEILSACRRVNPEFCLSVESAWDRLLSYTDVAWIWHSNLGTPDHIPAFKYAFPQWLPSTFACQPYDYTDVNNAVRFGYQLYLGPARYTASMGDEQTRPLSEYVREVLRVWEEVRDTIFDGDFLDKEGAHVQWKGPIYYSTHRNRATGTRACVLVNAGDVPGLASVAFEGGAGRPATIRRPFAAVEESRQPVAVTIPPDRMAIVVEG